MFISIILGTIIGRAITECLFKDGDKEIEKMKDEEMAEEYICIRKCQDDGKKSFVYCRTCTRLEDFLEGLKAGRPQWHEIESKVSPKREISKRYMPKNKEKVLLKYHFSDEEEIHISDGYYDAYDFEFHIANNPKYRIVCVIAWCEIPTFDKE